MKTFIASVLLIGPLFASIGCNDCDFIERCDGDTREICGGVDQVVNRHIERVPCEGLDPVCIELDGGETLCATTSTRCDPETYRGRCEGDVAFACIVGFETATDCAAVEEEGAPFQCVEPAGVGSAACE